MGLDFARKSRGIDESTVIPGDRGGKRMTTVDILANTQTPIHARLLINGEWVEGAERMDVRNPAHPDELVGSIVRGTPADVDRAVAAAKAAQVGWAALGYRGRGEILGRCLDALEDNIDARAFLFVRENGKTLRAAN
jgi:delta 1-pyrroline-5-carboxylate dehydrogenase